MGIPKLNKWLLSNCSLHSIKRHSLTDFQDKRIAVDISIYLYKFLMDGRYMESLYLFFSILKYYCIQPVIVFDGKAPAEKRATIQKRNKDKQDAQSQYSAFETQLAEAEDEGAKRDIQYRMSVLKKRMVRVGWPQIDAAIELLKAFGFEYYLAPHEADQLCVHLAQTGDVYAILSDDMDLLISGVPRVLRGLNIVTHDVFLYDTNAIMSDIKMNLTDFRETVVLSGTDYEMKHPPPSLTIKRCFELYREYKAEETSNDIQFHDWLGHKGLVDPVEFQHICALFDNTTAFNELTEFVEKNRTETCKLNIPEIKNIMKPHKFIFV
jgi:5'-3' exonuclease